MFHKAAPLALVLASAASGAWTQQGAKLVITGGSGQSQCGFVNLSSDGNTLVQSCAYDATQTGAIVVYVRTAGSWAQQGSKLTATGLASGHYFGQGLAISGDGNTILAGTDSTGNPGAAYVFTRSGTAWSQQGSALSATGNTGFANFAERGVALSSDGNTAIIGGSNDNSSIGAFWVFTRSGTTWTQQAGPLVSTGATGAAKQGTAASLSGDGNTAIVCGASDNTGIGACWFWTRSGATWTQQGGKMVGTGNTGASGQGGGSGYNGVRLSLDGNTAAVGGNNDNSNTGAVWVFTRSAGTWTQQAGPLIGTGGSAPSRQGASVGLSSDGNTLVVGGPNDSGNIGAYWLWTRSGTIWTQQGAKVVGTGATNTPTGAAQGYEISISSDATTIASGGNGDNSNVGAAWIFTTAGAPTGHTRHRVVNR